MSNIEVEIKLEVSGQEFNRVKDKLKQISKFEKVINQIDEYFDLPHRSFLDCEYPYEWISIRKRGNKNLFQFKRLFPPNTLEFSHAEEFETEVKDIDKLREILLLIDIKSLVIVDKTRETYNYNDEFEIALDSVKDLGYFIEIEAKKDFGGVEETKKRVIEFAESIGIDSSKRVKRGYPYLLMEKKGLIKNID